MLSTVVTRAEIYMKTTRRCRMAPWHGMTNPALWVKPELMAKARREEIACAYFKDMGVYRKVPLSKCLEVTGQDPIAVRWVDINKGDTAPPD